MKLYDIVFYAAGFFLIGVLFYSLKSGIILVSILTAILGVLFLFVGYIKKQNKNFWLASLVLAIILGALYSAFYDWRVNSKINIVFNRKINFTAVVNSEPKIGKAQKLVINFKPPYYGKISVNLDSYPAFEYGDLINFEGLINKPDSIYAEGLAKDGIFGTLNFPKAQLISKGNGSFLKSALFRLKEKGIRNIQNALSFEKAAFLSGLIFGERAEFENELKTAMKNSGTTHLVALSGYNVSIIAWAVAGLFAWFFSRRWTFVLSIGAVIIFVLMTGAEASVVRAAIMGSIFILAEHSGRVYSSRNAIVIAAFLMVLANPKILKFDIGFQLSFLALLGIVYLSPALKKILRWEDVKGMIQETFFTTLSAQLAVAPILIIYFGSFSLISLLANILILEFIPLTMALGFMIAILGFVSQYFSLVTGWLANIFLGYELFIVKFFGNLNFGRIESISIFIFIGYYFFLLAIIVFSRLKPSLVSQNKIS